MIMPKQNRQLSPAGVFILLLLAALMLPSCTGKITRHYFISGPYKRFNRGLGFGEGEFSTPRFLHGRLDVAIQGGVKTMEEQGKIETTEGTMPQFTRDIQYLAGSPRLFPIGWKGVAPFVGGGLGYYRYSTLFRYGGRDVTCPYGWTWAECQELKGDRHTLAAGLGKHVGAGIYLPLSKAFGNSEAQQFRLVLGLELRYYFLNLDPAKNIDLSGRQGLISFGLAWK